MHRPCSVNMAASLSIHQEVLFVYCGPILREPKSRPVEWESLNKGLSSPPTWASDGLRTQPALSLSLSFWPSMSDSFTTKNFALVQKLDDYTVKKTPACPTRRVELQTFTDGHLCPPTQDPEDSLPALTGGGYFVGRETQNLFYPYFTALVIFILCPMSTQNATILT